MNPSRNGLVLWLPLGLFVALALFGVSVHEMWRDELEIWLVARDSGSILDLMHNLKTQGHPALWYLLVYLVTRVTENPFAMQLLSVAIGTATAWVVLRHAPFDTFQRWMFVFGYYLLYEYTVISRHYGLALLLVCLFCARFVRIRSLDRVGTLLLVLLANTTIQGAIIAAHILLLMVFRDGLQAGWNALRHDRRLRMQALIVVLGVIAGTAQVLFEGLAMGEAHVGAYRPGWDIAWLGASIGTISRGWIALPDPTDIHIWNSSMLSLLPAGIRTLIGPLLGLVLVAAAVRSLYRQRTLCIIFLLGSSVLLCIVLFVWFGYMRHHGQIFLWFVTCCWLWHGLRGKDDVPRAGPGGRLLTTSLGLQWVALLLLFVADVRQPFSNARVVGEYLSRPEFEGITVIGSIDYAAEPVNAYRPGKIYYPENDHFGTFIDWGPQRRHVDVREVMADASRLAGDSGKDVIVLLNYPPSNMGVGDTGRWEDGSYLRYFGRFTGAMVSDENYHLLQLATRPLDADQANVDSPADPPDND